MRLLSMTGLAPEEAANGSHTYLYHRHHEQLQGQHHDQLQVQCLGSILKKIGIIGVHISGESNVHVCV